MSHSNVLKTGNGSSSMEAGENDTVVTFSLFFFFFTSVSQTQTERCVRRLERRWMDNCYLCVGKGVKVSVYTPVSCVHHKGWSQ